ncbi:DUF3800 domain-containing protein [Desulfovibrio sp. JC010]|uniref:DUF3800 domain-containing protein n=1 Tax=Desulfovibrio sp. JC010 TaxID=2593641 RepID=UPI0013D5D89C|nr:DUF3800 domain-containing protein [Desulfovibrio sp. JC010]NDV28618.1 DUF3800 domain-containing protein [Desulfovibrio sp. JC010]
MPQFSDYIVYVDESGDHSLTSINKDYPVFVLSFCVFHKTTYANSVVPDLINLKFKHFGHDMIILHEREIRKQKRPFNILRDREYRNTFLNELSSFVEQSDFTLISVAINKLNLVSQYTDPQNPYEMAMKYGLERIFHFLEQNNQEKLKTTFIFESRGNREDKDLELEFRRVCDGANWRQIPFPFKLKMASKKCNSCGLQLADLTARPIGQHVLNPFKRSRAFDALSPKLYSSNGSTYGWGLKIFPR